VTDGTNRETQAHDAENSAVRSVGWGEREQRDIVARRGLNLSGGYERTTTTTMIARSDVVSSPAASEDTPSRETRARKRVSLQEARAVALVALERAESRRAASSGVSIDSE
jgi:hypothetical protein